jgi:SAM-dependent methyltransferase
VSGPEPYGALAGVYDWLVPDALLEPEGSAAAFRDVVDPLPAGARVLDCACGTGLVAVGLALRGFEVVAADASAAMVERARALAAERGAALEAVTCAWEALDRQGWTGRFDAVLCVGNSLTHARGREGRRDALRAMAGVLREGGVLAVTSRNWELVRAEGPGLRVAERLVTRGAVDGLVIHGWTLAEGWEERHDLDVAVALLDGAGGVTVHHERLAFWPFTRETLDGDLRASGLEPVASTYAPAVERYLVTARRPAPPPAPA